MDFELETSVLESPTEVAAVFLDGIGRLVCAAKQRNDGPFHWSRMDARSSHARALSSPASRIGEHWSETVILFLHQKVAQDESVHTGTEECADGVGGRVDDSLTAKVE